MPRRTTEDAKRGSPQDSPKHATSVPAASSTQASPTTPSARTSSPAIASPRRQSSPASPRRQTAPDSSRGEKAAPSKQKRHHKAPADHTSNSSSDATLRDIGQKKSSLPTSTSELANDAAGQRLPSFPEGSADSNDDAAGCKKVLERRSVASAPGASLQSAEQVTLDSNKSATWPSFDSAEAPEPVVHTSSKKSNSSGRKHGAAKKHSTSAALSQKLKDVDSSGVDAAVAVATGTKPREEVGETGDVEDGDADNAVAADVYPIGLMDARKHQKPSGRVRAKASASKKSVKYASPASPPTSPVAASPTSPDTGDKSSSSTAIPSCSISVTAPEEAGAVPQTGLPRDIGLVEDEADNCCLPRSSHVPRPSPRHDPGDSVPPIFLQGPGEHPQRLRLENYEAPIIPEHKSVKPNLRYFRFAGRAETTRLIAAVGGLEIEETPEVTDKASFGLPGTLPCLDHLQVQITHSFAVELYVARLAPKFIILTEKQKAIDGMFCKMKEDMFKGFASILMDILADDTKKDTAVVDVAKVAEKWFPILEGRLPGSCGEFIHGLMFPTAADLAVLNVAVAFMPFGAAYDIGRYDVFNQHPKFAAHVDRVSRYPEVKAYLSRSKTMDSDPFELRPSASSSDGSSESFEDDEELWGPEDVTTMSRAMGYHESMTDDHESSEEDDEDWLSESSCNSPATPSTQISSVEERRLREVKQQSSFERVAARKEEKDKRDRAMIGSSRFGGRGRKNSDGRPRWKTMFGSIWGSTSTGSSSEGNGIRKSRTTQANASKGTESLVCGREHSDHSGVTKPSSWSSFLSKAAGFFKRNKPDMRAAKG